MEAVRGLVGNVARYDFQTAGHDIPRLDLPALEPFFRNAMTLNDRRVTRSDGGLSVATPESWRASPDLRSRYDELFFDRSLPGDRALVHLIGVGHALLDRALADAQARAVHVGRAQGLDSPFLLAMAEDEVTGTDATVHRVAIGFVSRAGEPPAVLRDWEALIRLNALQSGAGEEVPLAEGERADARALLASLPPASGLDLPFRRPKLNAVLILLPVQSAKPA